MRCLSVRPSVTFVHYVETNKHIYNIFTPAGSQAILVFLHQMTWQYSDGNPPNGGVECRWRSLKSRFGAHIWLHCVLLTLLPARCYQYDAVGPPSCKLWHFAGSKRRCLLMAGKDDEMFMTRSFNVAPKTTGQHLIARSDKSVEYVTNNKTLLDVFLLSKLTTDRHETSATAELLVNWVWNRTSASYHFFALIML